MVQADAVPEPTDAVTLTIPDCQQVPADEIAKLVALELSPRATVTTDLPPETGTRAWLECSQEDAKIFVQDTQRAEPLAITLKLTDTAPEARPRLLALAMAELIATSQLERQEPKPAAPAAKHVHRLQLWLAGGLLWLAEPKLLAPAVALGVVGGIDWLALAADLRFERGKERVSDASLTMTTLSLGLWPSFWLTRGRWELLLGAGLRVGYARVQAEALDRAVRGRSLAGAWLAPGASAVGQLQITTRVRLRVGIELAYVTRSLRGLDAEGQALFELHGLSLAPSAGFSLAL